MVVMMMARFDRVILLVATRTVGRTGRVIWRLIGRCVLEARLSVYGDKVLSELPSCCVSNLTLLRLASIVLKACMLSLLGGGTTGT